MEVYDSDFEVVEKEDNSPLTVADLAAHRIIADGLREIAPDLPVLSEESSEQAPFELRSRWQRYWLVDPLDGTREFIKRNGEFTVNIALIEDGVPTLGVVYVPALNRCYYGTRGDGAFRIDDSETPVAIHPVSAPADTVRVVGSRSHRGDSLKRFLEQLGRHEMVPMGSSLKICLVAEGSADIYPRLGPTSEWDTAAAQAVAEAAGARVLRLDGTPLRYNQKPELLNPYFVVIGDSRRDWLQYF